MYTTVDNVTGQITSFIKGVGPNDSGGVIIKANPQFVSTMTGRLQPYQNFPRTMKPALEAVADYVRVTMIPRTFKQEGPGWRQLSLRTRMERQATGFPAQHPILRRTGDLFDEVSQKSHPNHIEVIRTGKNCRIIIGGSSEKFIRNQGGNAEFHIPPRSMIPGTGGLAVSPDDRREMVNIMKSSIEQVMAARQ